jgi:hypothetical protein
MTELAIARHPGVDISVKGVQYLQQGRQPFFHRGDCLVRLWCERTGKPREEIPTGEVLRGHRRARQARDASPQMRNAQALMEAIKPPVQRKPTKAPPRRKAKAVA